MQCESLRSVSNSSWLYFVLRASFAFQVSGRSLDEQMSDKMACLHLSAVNVLSEQGCH